MIELLTAIAMWCGQPAGNVDKPLYQPQQVNKCREVLFFCSTEYSVMIEKRVIKSESEIAACFGNSKI